MRKRYERGPNKIEGYLRQRGFNVPHNIIYRIIYEEGLNNPLDRPRRTWGKKRFEKEHTNSLWQADFFARTIIGRSASRTIIQGSSPARRRRGILQAKMPYNSLRGL